ncbi:MAG: hypothetical protein WA517_22755 [Candidatus Acidiferrum sp.]
MKRGELVRIEQFGSIRMVLIQFADLAPRTANFCAGCFKYGLVVGVLPQNQVLDDLEESLPLDCGFLLILSVFEAASLLVTGIVDKLGKDDSTGRCQRPPGPPQMQCRGMPVPDGFLLRCRDIDGIERQSNLNELAGRFYGVLRHGRTIDAQ